MTTNAKNLFITGSEGQLGLSLAKQFDSLGWKVHGLDLHEESSNSFLARYIQGSVTSRESFRKLYDIQPSTEEEVIQPQFCLINNAGIAVFTPSEDRTAEEFTAVSEINLLGPIFGMTEFYKFANQVQIKASFSIINISSIYGLLAPNQTIYSDTARNSSEIYGATKAGLSQMTKYFATRYASFPIKVNCIAPGGVSNTKLQGPIFTENYSALVPMKRLCYDQEVASLASKLAAEGCDYLTGQTIALDGGMSAW